MYFASSIFAPLAVLSTFAKASPVLEARDVFVPPILEPVAGAIWTKGSTQSVAWDISDPPAQISNRTGIIYLRDVKLESILIDLPLASGFDILDAQHNVVVPTDIPAGPYQIVLIGNSGNWSPTFDIVD